MAPLLFALLLSQYNPADLEERCSTDRLTIPDDDFGWDMFLKSKEADIKKLGAEVFFTRLLLEGELRAKPLPAVMSYVKATRFYNRKAQAQALFEKLLAQTPEEGLAKAEGNYALAMMYLGDFNKVIAFFGPGSPRHQRALKNDEVTFALANAYFRLQRWEEANRFARISFKLKDQLDSRWMLMTTDVGLNKAAWVEKHDEEEYTSRFVTELFPAKNWSAVPYEDVTAKLGINALGGTGSVSFVDFDGDGWDELIWERKFFPFQIYKNSRGTFTPLPKEKLGHDDCTGIIAVPGDVDNDGKPDFFRHCCNYDGAGPAWLLKNQGELTFQDITKGSGLEFDQGYGMVAAWADYDLDGHLDLAVGDARATTRLYRNTGKGTFVEVTGPAGTKTPGRPDNWASTGRTWDGAWAFGTVGVAWGDLDVDGYPDLFIQGWGWKRLFMNKKDGTFKDVTKAAGLDLAQGINGYTGQIFDYDNDGLLDIYAGQYVVSSGVKWGFAPVCTCSNLLKKTGYSAREWAHASTVYKNLGGGKFKDMAAHTRFLPLGTMGAINGDWDNDGDQDIVMGAGGPYFQQAEPFLFYENLGGGQFALRTPFYDLSNWGKGHGGAFGDYDHDGNLDLALNNGGATMGDIWPSRLLHNTGSPNHWLELSLRGAPGTNRFALGARVEVKAGGKSYVQELWSGPGFGAANTFRLHFGLGKAAKVDSVSIRWPNKKLTTTVLKDVPADQAIEVSEADGSVKQLWSSPRK